MKVLKGNYDIKTIHFASAYCNEFGYTRPLNDNYIIIGVVMDKDGNYHQTYIEKVYYKKTNGYYLIQKSIHSSII